MQRQAEEIMSYLRERIFGQDPDIPKGPGRRRWIVILAIVVLVGVGIELAWEQGIVSAVAIALKPFVVAIWNMLSDLAAACWDFLQYVLHQRSH